MRLLFLVLLLANALLFVWGQSHWGGEAAGREPERLSRQLAPEKLRIVSKDGKAEAAPPQKACRRIEWLAKPEAEAMLSAIESLAGWEGRLVPRAEEPAHWVLIGHLADRAAAEKKRNELRQLGVTENEIVEDAAQGPFVVSLGVFRSQTLAEEHLQALAKKGVRSARLGKRELPPFRFAVELTAPAQELPAKLPELIRDSTHLVIGECLAS
ncbi:MAG: SPOR domain-containing protein [Rhodocyclaceae bacterium]|nr:SPOR domain-containing protein [Rhodocyclaceae bacterium]